MKCGLRFGSVFVLFWAGFNKDWSLYGMQASGDCFLAFIKKGSAGGVSAELSVGMVSRLQVTVSLNLKP